MGQPAGGAPRHLAAGIYRARVTRVKAGRYWVVARDLLGDAELGGQNGFELLDPTGFPGTPFSALTTGSTAVGDHGGHTHALLRAAAALKAGDRVLVASVAGRATDLVVLGRLTP